MEEEEEEDCSEPFAGSDTRCAGQLGAPIGHVSGQRHSQAIKTQ